MRAGRLLFGTLVLAAVLAAVEAARLMPGRVVGLIGVDTLENVEYPMTREELGKMIAPLKKDFRAGCRKFVEGMISPKTDPPLREWILADMAAAPPFEAVVLPGADHFLMMSRPEEFNRALGNAVRMLPGG